MVYQSNRVQVVSPMSIPTKTATFENRPITTPMRPDFAQLSDEELLAQKTKVDQSKTTHALLIGFLAGVLIFGCVAWLLSDNKRIGFFIPMLFPAWFIYSAIKKNRAKQALAEELKRRGLI